MYFLTDEQKQILPKLWAMVEEAIATNDYSLIRDALCLAYENDIYMSESDDHVYVEDDRFDFNGAF